MKREMIRQGDVLLIPVSEVPRGATIIPNEIEGRVVLAYGEATGHHHSLRAATAKLFDHDRKRYLLAEPQALLEHQEHGHIALNGAYLVVRQVEYTPEAIRNVAD